MRKLLPSLSVSPAERLRVKSVDMCPGLAQHWHCGVCLSFPFPELGHPCSRLQCCLGKTFYSLNHAGAEHHHKQDYPKGKCRQQQLNVSGGEEVP